MDAEGTKRAIADRGLRIVVPKGDADRQQAILRALKTPPIIAEILATGDGGIPSDESIRDHLRSAKFAESGIEKFLKAFSKTMDFVGRQTWYLREYGAEGEVRDTPSQQDQSQGDQNNQTRHSETVVLGDDGVVALAFTRKPTLKDMQILKEYAEFRINSLQKSD